MKMQIMRSTLCTTGGVTSVALQVVRVVATIHVQDLVKAVVTDCVGKDARAVVKAPVIWVAMAAARGWTLALCGDT